MLDVRLSCPHSKIRKQTRNQQSIFPFRLKFRNVEAAKREAISRNPANRRSINDGLKTCQIVSWLKARSMQNAKGLLRRTTLPRAWQSASNLRQLRKSAVRGSRSVAHAVAENCGCERDKNNELHY